MKFECECCDYKTNDESNFNKHNASSSHKEEKEIAAYRELLELILEMNILLRKVEESYRREIALRRRIFEMKSK